MVNKNSHQYAYINPRLQSDWLNRVLTAKLVIQKNKKATVELNNPIQFTLMQPRAVVQFTLHVVLSLSTISLPLEYHPYGQLVRLVWSSVSMDRRL